jgi:hypothetical protein
MSINHRSLFSSSQFSTTTQLQKSVAQSSNDYWTPLLPELNLSAQEKEMKHRPFASQNEDSKIKDVFTFQGKKIQLKTTPNIFYPKTEEDRKLADIVRHASINVPDNQKHDSMSYVLHKANEYTQP